MKNLIVLQENSGQVGFLNLIPNPTIKNIVKGILDKVVEGFMSAKTKLQLNGYYDSIIDLSDKKCTKKLLLDEMIKLSKSGIDVFDLLILGHGSPDTLYLHGTETMKSSDIRQFLTTARNQNPGLNFKLRMVYMCNCFGDSVSTAWQAIGAKMVLGCSNINYMPEPQINNFFDNFVKRGMDANSANLKSFEDSKQFWTIASGLQGGLTLSQINGSKLRRRGENLRFDGRRLAVGERVYRNIHANSVYNYTNIFIIKGERYQFGTDTADRWRNGSKSSNANGYVKTFFDSPRQPSYKMMQMVGELFDNNGPGGLFSFNGTHFRIGTSRTWTATKSGYLVCFANDAIPFYGDNSGLINLSVRRIS